MNVRMHADEVGTDVGLVRRLVRGQCPQWAALPVRPVPSGGTDAALYRLGDDLVARLPRIGWAVEQIAGDGRWLPRLAPHLPVPVTEQVAAFEPAEGYPYPWAVYRWLPGDNPVAGRLADPAGLALDVAGFVTALRAVDPAGGPVAGGALRGRDAGVRASIAALVPTDGVDVAAVTAAWERALTAPEHTGPPVWVHRDLLPGNLLVAAGRLVGVIDFALGVGDPALDLLTAWTLFSAAEREVFRRALAVDDGAWDRGRGHALAKALVALPYYRETNPYLAGIARWTIGEVLGGP